MTITTQSPCSNFPSGNYSPALQIFHTIREPYKFWDEPVIAQVQSYEIDAKTRNVNII